MSKATDSPPRSRPRTKGLGRPSKSPPRLRPRTRGLGRSTDFPPRSRPRAKGLGRGTDFPSRPRPRAYSLGRDADSPPRSRPARQNNPVASASTNFSDKDVVSDRRVRPLPRYQPNDGSTQRRGRLNASHVDATPSSTGQGLPGTVLSTVPTTGAHTALSYLTPAPETRRAESHPGYYSLEISVQNQLLPPRLGSLL